MPPAQHSSRPYSWDGAQPPLALLLLTELRALAGVPLSPVTTLLPSAGSMSTVRHSLLCFLVPPGQVQAGPSRDAWVASGGGVAPPHLCISSPSLPAEDPTLARPDPPSAPPSSQAPHQPPFLSPSSSGHPLLPAICPASSPPAQARVPQTVLGGPESKYMSVGATAPPLHYCTKAVPDGPPPAGVCVPAESH